MPDAAEQVAIKSPRDLLYIIINEKQEKSASRKFFIDNQFKECIVETSGFPLSRE
jgi:hypothetical protein